MTHTATILGLEVPLAGPVFYAVLAVHVPVALIAVISGALAALFRKGTPRHIRSGRVYFWSISLVFATSTILAALRWREDYHLFLIGMAAFAAACVGHLSRNRHGPGHTLHILGMSTSYISMLIAFYIDNGPQLPVWNQLPHITYWLLPAVVGGVITTYALRRTRRLA